MHLFQQSQNNILQIFITLWKLENPFFPLPLPGFVFLHHLRQQLVAVGLLLKAGWKFTSLRWGNAWKNSVFCFAQYSYVFGVGVGFFLFFVLLE